MGNFSLQSSTSVINNYNQYTNQLGKLFKMVEDAGYNFIINCNQTFIKMTNIYDNIGKYICDVLRPVMLKTVSDLVSQLEQLREIQQRKRYNIYL